IQRSSTRRRLPPLRGRRPTCAAPLRPRWHQDQRPVPRSRPHQHVLSTSAFLPAGVSPPANLFSSNRKVRRVSVQVVHPQVLVITPRLPSPRHLPLKVRSCP